MQTSLEIYIFSRNLAKNYTRYLGAEKTCAQKIRKVEDVFFGNLAYVVIDGSCLFWWDNWSGLGKLADRCVDANLPLETAMLRDLYSPELGWNLESVHDALNKNDIHHIQLLHFVFSKVTDAPVWMPKNSGQFTLSSAIHIVRQRKQVHPHLSIVWHPRLPLNMSFFIWRLLNVKLPFPDTLKEIGFSLPSVCILSTQRHLATLLLWMLHCFFIMVFFRTTLELALPLSKYFASVGSMVGFS